MPSEQHDDTRFEEASRPLSTPVRPDSRSSREHSIALNHDHRGVEQNASAVLPGEVVSLLLAAMLLSLNKIADRAPVDDESVEDIDNGDAEVGLGWAMTARSRFTVLAGLGSISGTPCSSMRRVTNSWMASRHRWPMSVRFCVDSSSHSSISALRHLSKAARYLAAKASDETRSSTRFSWAAIGASTFLCSWS